MNDAYDHPDRWTCMFFAKPTERATLFDLVETAHQRREREREREERERESSEL